MPTSTPLTCEWHNYDADLLTCPLQGLSVRKINKICLTFFFRVRFFPFLFFIRIRVPSRQLRQVLRASG